MTEHSSTSNEGRAAMLRYFEQIDQAYERLRGPELEAELAALTRRAREEQGPESAVYASMLSELGGYHRGQGRYEDAQREFRQAADLLRKSAGERSPDYATALNNLAGTLRLMGSFDEAEGLFKACLDIYGESVGDMSLYYASALNNLSLLAMDRRDYVRAERLLRRSADFLTALPSCRDEYASSLVNLASLHRFVGRPDEARRELLEALELYENGLGTATPHYHAALNLLGLLCRDAANDRDAALWFAKALDAAQALYGPEHPEAADIRRQLYSVTRREDRE